MKQCRITHTSGVEINTQILLPGSKSITNRILILNALSGNKTQLSNESPSTDSILLKAALESTTDIYWFDDGATPYRFFLAYAAATQKLCTLTGSAGLQKRSIEFLCNTLEDMGAQFQFENTNGYPPVSIQKGIDTFTECSIDPTYSSQFASSLMLIAPLFPEEKTIHLNGKPVSEPYMRLTADCMKIFGINTQFSNHTIKVESGHFNPPKEYAIESDWSAAAFFYALCAVTPGSNFQIPFLYKNSAQGDSVVEIFFQSLGVHTTFFSNHIQLTHTGQINPNFQADFTNCPDLAPAVISTCAYLNIHAQFTGIQNLRYKESDRIRSLSENLKPLGFALNTEKNHAWLIKDHSFVANDNTIEIQSFNDHRIAMAFSIWANKHSLIIDNADCVNKSFPGFWEELQKCNFVITSGT